MAWIKIGERDIINADAIKTIAIQQFRDGSYYVRFSLNDDDSIISIPCDGVEVEKYSGGLDRVDKDFFFSVQDGEGFVSNLNSLREAIRVLARINFDTEMLFYVSSW